MKLFVESELIEFQVRFIISSLALMSTDLRCYVAPLSVLTRADSTPQKAESLNLRLGVNYLGRYNSAVLKDSETAGTKMFKAFQFIAAHWM